MKRVFLLGVVGGLAVFAVLSIPMAFAGPGMQGGGLTGGGSSGCSNCLVDDGGFSVVGNYLPIDGGTVTGSVGIQAGLVVGTRDGGPGLVIATGGAQFNVTPGLKTGLDEGYGAIQIGNASSLIQGNSSYLFLSGPVGVKFSNGVNGPWSDGANLMDNAGQKVPYVHGSGTATQAIESGRSSATAGALAVTFGTAFGGVPACNCTTENATTLACFISTAPTINGVTFSSTGAGTDLIDWICIGAR